MISRLHSLDAPVELEVGMRRCGVAAGEPALALARVIVGLGIRHAGPTAAVALSRAFPDLDAIVAASAVDAIDVGESILLQLVFQVAGGVSELAEDDDLFGAKLRRDS